MAIILIEKDPFVEAEASQFTKIETEQFNVRRPFYGLSIKDPRHAFLSVYQENGNGSLVPISLKDSSAPGGWSNANHNFILTDVAESRQEKVQIMETFGDHFVWFYGEKPIILACSGFLLNSEDFNWKNEWFYNYEKFLRGTRCVENRARVFMGFDDVLVQGYILNCQVPLSKDMPNVCPFSFQLLLSKLPLDLSPAGGDEVPIANTNYVTSTEKARAFVSDGTLVEYINGVEIDNIYRVDPVTGESKTRSNAAPEVPDTADSPRTAYWLTETQPSERQWRDEHEALLEINTKLASLQSGVDSVTTRQALRASPENFQLASRTDSVLAIAQALTTGVSNAAAVIPDTTGLE